MSDEKITSEKLKENLCYIKKTLEKYEADNNNIIFISLDSFYSYLDNFYGNKYESIRNIIKQIEPYIPLSLCIDNDSFYLLVKAFESNNDKEIEQIENIFYKKATMDFLKTIANARTESQWNKIISMCQKLHSFNYS